MKDALYRNLQHKIIAITLLVSFAPLILLGVTIYHQFSRMHHGQIEHQIRYRAQAQVETVELFLKKRVAILAAIADIHRFEDIIEPSTLSRLLQIMNTRAGGFVDLGVIDDKGRHQAYVGPFHLLGLRYEDEPWFAEVMSKGIYISDVYLGFRRLPHFIIAVRHTDDTRSWVLRATIDQGALTAIVRAAKVGKTGDAFLVNRSGIYQTRPRFHGKLLEPSNLETSRFGEGTTVLEMHVREKGNGTLMHAGSWLKNKDWLLVISQETDEENAALFETRNMEILIITIGILAIVLTTVLTTRFSVSRMKQADQTTNELNAQLVQSDKLAAIGKMAAGVAHEINNPLAVIIQKTGWMEDLLKEEEFKKSPNYEEFQKSIHKIEEHVERARKVVHSMLGYARRMEPRLDDVDVNKTLNDTISLLENFARINNIDIQTNFEKNLPIIAADQSQLQQVFFNLLTNAIDAIGDNGLIEISSRLADGFIRVDVRDDGPGIAEEFQKKIFDPFFSTKETGGGTGLGLWVSYNIIEKMGGDITLNSQAGQGTVFTVSIPIVHPEKK